MISAIELNAALNSKSKELKTLIADVSGVNVSNFLKVLTISVTPKYDDLMNENERQLEAHGFSRAEVETLFFPNAIHTRLHSRP